jgi:hypothetical protein
MNRFLIVLQRLGAVVSLILMNGLACAAPDPQVADSGSSTRLTTNGPVVFQSRMIAAQALQGPPVAYYPPPTELPPELRRDMLTFVSAANVTVVKGSSNRFDHFLPESLNNLVWTNFIAHTNGRNMLVWSTRSHPPGWPAQPSQLEWNPTCLMAGMRGMTALSPCWELEGNPGQAPITALTRRHGYARGHDMGPDGVGSTWAGKKVWFLTAQNKVIQMTVAREVVRTAPVARRDYTILLFSSDLPDSIQPMRVVPEKDIFSLPHSKYVGLTDVPSPVFKTEQSGYVSADVPGFTVNTYKGGDSGSPNMLPLPGELVFWNGRSTSGASPEMQADMDQLCRLQGLDPKKYQLEWVDLSAFPVY